jgi:RNA polymerase sigma factor (TIGR02999 family)
MGLRANDNGSKSRPASEVTGLLNAAVAGDHAAQDAAYALVYAELKRVAERQSRLAHGSTLTPTALVSELFLKLQGVGEDKIENRQHFFGLAARAMRQVVVDHARHRAREKRGGAAEHVELQDETPDAGTLGNTTAAQALELDRALTDLQRRDADLARVVEWHFFGGLTFQEIADATGRHERTIRHDWELARAFLNKAMSADS